MKTTTYNKLIRDKIPEIIKSSGKVANTEILSEKDYIEKLDEKLIEELKEYQECKNIEELADMLEVIYAIALAKGTSITELEDIRIKKANDRGSFNNKIFLKSVTEE